MVTVTEEIVIESENETDVPSGVDFAIYDRDPVFGHWTS